MEHERQNKHDNKSPLRSTLRVLMCRAKRDSRVGSIPNNESVFRSLANSDSVFRSLANSDSVFRSPANSDSGFGSRASNH